VPPKGCPHTRIYSIHVAVWHSLGTQKSKIELFKCPWWPTGLFDDHHGFDIPT